MSSNRQKSFVATLQLYNEHLHLLDNLHKEPIKRTVTIFSGGFYTGASSTVDDSYLLGLRPREHSVDITPLKLYFRCAEDYYTLKILSPGAHTDKYLSKDDFGVLGAFPAAGSETTSFNLLDMNNNIITLDQLHGESQRIRLKARNAGQISASLRRGAPYIYLADIKSQGLEFKLRISERNVPYPDDPNDI
ncbi:hypothetical protein ACIOZM_13550 [Pseudomonas sp. NPDC087346]|uniref:hypothetical protein n=1 Tax=Pseudomonas sp. NPDC087346 TaxID=3364438 RepID=UPI003810D6E4